MRVEIFLALFHVKTFRRETVCKPVWLPNVDTTDNQIAPLSSVSTQKLECSACQINPLIIIRQFKYQEVFCTLVSVGKSSYHCQMWIDCQMSNITSVPPHQQCIGTLGCLGFSYVRISPLSLRYRTLPDIEVL